MDPYRIYFPLGILLGIAGVSIWPLYHWGVTSDFLHVMFIGGFTLLILAVGTRVVLSHGGHALTEEHIRL